MENKQKILFDTYAIIAYAQEEEGSEVIERFLLDIDSGKSEGGISAMTLTEILCSVGRINIKKADKLIEYLENSKIKIINVSKKISKDAGNLKLKYRKVDLSTADAIIIATAIDYGADLVVTGDDEWKNVKEIDVFEI